MELQLLSFPVIFTAIIFLFLLKKICNNTTKPAPNLPPGPKKFPIIGNMHQLVGPPPHRRLRDLAKEYGSVMHLQLGEVSQVVVSSAEAAKQMMKTHDTSFASRPFHLGASIILYNFSDVAFAPYGDSWRKMRKICTLELLSAKRVQSFRPIREEEVSKFIDEIYACAGSPFNFSKKLFALTYAITARALFGKKCKDQDEFIPLVQEMMVTGTGFSLSEVFPSVKLLHMISGMRGKLKRQSRKADKIIEDIIADHKSGREDGSKSGDREDLVDVLLRVQSEEDIDLTLTDENIKATILEVFMVGSDSTSTTMEWAMAELLKNPRVMEKAQAEVRKVYGKKGKVDESEIHELKYLKLVIKEALRLHTPAPLLLPRECRETCEIGGYTIPEKTTVIVNAWAIGRDPKYWDDPEAFKPERFLDNDVDFKGNDFELVPFGAGRRMCPGITFALGNIELQMAQLLYHFDWELADGQNLESLDMSELFGATVRRKNDLHLIPIPYKREPCESIH